MITPTHVLGNTWLASRAPAGTDRRTLRAFVLGGVAPDVPLYLLSAGSVVVFAMTRDWAPAESLSFAFDTLFFEHPAWKAANSLLHAPFVLAALYGVARLRDGDGARRVRAFAAGAAVHAVVDVLTHHSDGPLVLFPFDWQTRFHSPVSYWEPEHFGRQLGLVDLAITVGLGVWAVLRWRRHGVVVGPVPVADDAADQHVDDHEEIAP